MKSVILILAVLITFSVTLAHAVIYTGAMDNRAGFPFVPGFTAQTRAWVTGDAPGGGLRLEWQVDNESTPGSWTYTYRLLRGVERNKGFAFFDIETAVDFTATNILARQVVSATDRFGAPIPSGLASITISDPVNFNAVHNFSNPTVTESIPSVTALNKSELNHYSGDPGKVAPGVPGSPASATPSVGPVPHPFYGIRVTFPDDTAVNLAFLTSEWEFRVVADRAPMWGKVFGWADQTVLTPFWYTNIYNDTIDNPDRLSLAPANSLTGAGPYRGWVLVPGSLPGVLSTIPADTAGGVPVTEPVSAVFNGLMDATTITSGTFTLSSISGSVSGTVSYDPSSKTATFQPNFLLTPNTTYTATIAAGVKDLAGNALSVPKTWSFTTTSPDTTPPSVLSTLPGNGAAYVATTSTFAATFSEAIDLSTLTSTNFSVAGLSGTIGYVAATRTATFTPSAPLANNATYTVIIGTGVKDLAGNPLAAPVQWSVTTIPQETVLPFVVSTFPAARAVNVVTTTTIAATFNEAIDPTTLTPSTFFVPGLSGTTSFDPASRTATFTPAAPLAGNTSYTLTVTTGVRDLAGNSVGLTKGFRFTTINTLSPTFSASGTVTDPGGNPLPGVSLLVTLISQSGTAKQIVVTDASGHYSANQLLSGQYLIVPSLAGTNFSPQNLATAITTASVSGLNFTGIPLAGSLIINGGAAVTRSASVTLAIIAPSNAGTITQMQFSKDGVTYFPFEPFAATRIVTLLPGDGLKTITVRFKDSAGNISAPISDTIILNTVLPTGTILINGGAAFTKTASATLALTATSTNGTITQMQFSKDGVTYFPFEPFAATRIVTLLPGDGPKTMTVRFKDSAGIVSAPVSASISLDTTPPTGTIAFTTSDPTISATGILALTASDATSGVTQMQFSKNGSVFFALEPFAASRSVSLAVGLNTLTVRFKDAAGNLSAPISATITRN